MPEPLYAVVEIMGHRTRAGAISDATMGGAPMLRIEHPTEAAHDGGPLVEYYAPASIFAIRPCSREVAEQAARYWSPPGPAPARELPAEFAELVDDDDYSVGDAYDEDGQVG